MTRKKVAGRRCNGGPAKVHQTRLLHPQCYHYLGQQSRALSGIAVKPPAVVRQGGVMTSLLVRRSKS